MNRRNKLNLLYKTFLSEYNIKFINFTIKRSIKTFSFYNVKVDYKVNRKYYFRKKLINLKITMIQYKLIVEVFLVLSKVLLHKVVPFEG